MSAFDSPIALAIALTLSGTPARCEQCRPFGQVVGGHDLTPIEDNRRPHALGNISPIELAVGVPTGSNHDRVRPGCGSGDVMDLGDASTHLISHGIDPHQWVMQYDFGATQQQKPWRSGRRAIRARRRSPA